MFILEAFSISLMMLLSFLCVKSDLETGIIRNKLLLSFAILAIVIDIIYYAFFVGDLLIEFLINNIVIIILSLFLFYSHSFAGGDSKLVIVLALLFPARYYLVYDQTNITLFFSIGFAILFGFLYLLLQSILAIITKKISITVDSIKNQSFTFLKSYLTAILYISFVNLFFIESYRLGFTSNIWLQRIVCVLTALCSSKFTVLKRKRIIMVVAFITLILSIILKTNPISFKLENYVLVLIILLCQMTIRANLYERVSISHLKNGMILSTISSVVMQGSITKGLPGVSKEDLSSRLTIEEVESIKIWAKATNTESLTIVKKIPFAIFIALGFVSYLLLWVIVKCI